ncbi:1-acyl-sn-glycerol-3-phosphate acyltransferase [Halomonas sp.]|uniref:1-acyl-sn-glycerol-3-phosphate acyltransferase n=1 Tax=Halomonas sp. TaxID=1486246 RepID=UPI003565DC30
MTLLPVLLAGALLLVLGWWLTRYPRPVIRWLVFLAVILCYRLRLRGQEGIPDQGPALVVCNHVSFMDALVVGGASHRPLRFLMDKPIYDSPWLNWLFRLVGAIPVETERRHPASIRRALEEIGRALDEGEVVMLFPEGRLTPDGDVHPFRRGLELILARHPVPVIPAGISGLWGSWTSHQGGPALSKPPRRFRPRVALHFSEPVPPGDVTRRDIEQRVRELKAVGDQWVEGPSREVVSHL